MQLLSAIVYKTGAAKIWEPGHPQPVRLGSQASGVCYIKHWSVCMECHGGSSQLLPELPSNRNPYLIKKKRLCILLRI